MVWCQEEPQNQGAWYRLRAYYRADALPHADRRVRGRPVSASTAVGYMSKHLAQQKQLIEDAFGAEPHDGRNARRDADDKQRNLMRVEVKVPQLPESVAEATLVSWHKKVGEAVARDENLVDVETDKVVLELPAPQAGVLVEIRQADGATVAGQEVIAVIDTDAAAVSVACRRDIALPTGTRRLPQLHPPRFRTAAAPPRLHRPRCPRPAR